MHLARIAVEAMATLFQPVRDGPGMHCQNTCISWKNTAFLVPIKQKDCAITILLKQYITFSRLVASTSRLPKREYPWLENTSA